MAFSQTIKCLRQEKSITALELSKKLNLSKNAVYEWEHGRSEPSHDTLVRIADIFECSVDYLLGRTDDFGNVSVITEGERLTNEEKELLATYRKMHSSIKPIALSTLHSLAGDKVQTSSESKGVLKKRA